MIQQPSCSAAYPFFHKSRNASPGFTQDKHLLLWRRAMGESVAKTILPRFAAVSDILPGKKDI